MLVWTFLMVSRRQHGVLIQRIITTTASVAGLLRNHTICSFPCMPNIAMTGLVMEQKTHQTITLILWAVMSGSISTTRQTMLTGEHILAQTNWQVRSSMRNQLSMVTLLL